MCKAPTVGNTIDIFSREAELRNIGRVYVEISFNTVYQEARGYWLRRTPWSWVVRIIIRVVRYRIRTWLIEPSSVDRIGHRNAIRSAGAQILKHPLVRLQQRIRSVSKHDTVTWANRSLTHQSTHGISWQHLHDEGRLPWGIREYRWAVLLNIWRHDQAVKLLQEYVVVNQLRYVLGSQDVEGLMPSKGRLLFLQVERH